MVFLARESEHRSASACKCRSATLIIDGDDNGKGGWTIASPEEDGGQLSQGMVPDGKADNAAGGDAATGQGDDDDNVRGRRAAKCQTLEEGTSIRVAPMERSCGGWSSEHFHEHLRLPEGSPAGRGIVVLLEAMARECIAVALSPYHGYELGKTYVVHLGANGNLQTVLRRHTNYQQCVDASFPCRVCDEESWIPYWIALQGGKLSAGVGRTPGRGLIGTLDDSMYNMLRSGPDAVKYVGIGNSALQRNARDLRVRGVAVAPIPPHFGEGMPIEESKFVNILDMGYGRRGNNAEGGSGAGGAVPTEAELLAEYERERAKARARAAKFCIEYKEPSPDAFLKWSEARRLRANPERGFITGIDTFSAAERAKAEARKERFAREERKRKAHGVEGDDESMENNEDYGKDDFAEWEKTKRDPLPVDQAWDNWRLVRQFRVDPPPGLLAGDNSRDKNVGIALSGAGGPAGETDEFVPRKVEEAPTKVHVFSIDWAPFKQIRTDDLMSYFRDYGPSYVEWLGELSCNVLFEDRHSAKRALHALSRELPSPPPQPERRNEVEGPPEVDAMEGAEGAIDEKGGDGEDTEKDLMDNVEDDPVDAADDNLDAESNDTGSVKGGEGETKQLLGEEELLPDLGGLGWRFCKWTVRKVSNDRYGRRGTRARLLMRPATSVDVLDDRPTEWPKPPPGFTTKRVLMPWHDFSGGRGNHRNHGVGGDSKRRRRGGGVGTGDAGRWDDYDGYCAGEGEHPGLSKGLRSGRSGFSVKELQAERNAKNAEILPA